MLLYIKRWDDASDCVRSEKRGIGEVEGGNGSWIIYRKWSREKIEWYVEAGKSCRMVRLVERRRGSYSCTIVKSRRSTDTERYEMTRSPGDSFCSRYISPYIFQDSAIGLTCFGSIQSGIGDQIIVPRKLTVTSLFEIRQEMWLFP